MGKAGLILLFLGISISLSGKLPEGYNTIFVDRTASREVWEAADELAGLLKRSFGESPELRVDSLLISKTGIHIGPIDAEILHKQADPTDVIRISRTGSGLEITGQDNRSTCFAVYRFIEKFLGWRLFQPGELGYERLDDPPSPPELDGEPQVLLQESAGYFSRNLDGLGNIANTGKWLVWNRLRERFSFNHNLYKIITPDQFLEHPDWFAKSASGEPKAPPFSVMNVNNDHPDLSNPELREYVAESCTKALLNIEHQDLLRVIHSPGTVSISLSLSDSFKFGNFGEHYEWRPKGYFRRWPDWSNHVFSFTNAVAELVKAQVPESKDKLYFGALAYLNWENTPDFPVHESIIPYLTFDRTQWYDIKSKADDLGTVSRWSESGVPFLGTWDYQFFDGFLIPRSLTAVIGESIPSLYDRGVRCYFSEIGDGWPYCGHTSWLTAQLLWNPKADPEALLQEYFDEYYGPVASSMRAFFNKTESLWMSQPDRGWWLRYWKDPWQAALWKPEDVKELDHLLEVALRESRVRMLSPTSGLSPTRFHSRVRQTADLFSLTKRFYKYQNDMWLLQSIDWDKVSEKERAAGAQQLEQLATSQKELRDQLGAKLPSTDLDWVFQYDSLKATSVALSIPRKAEEGRSRQILYDTDLSQISNPRIWQHYFLDSESLSKGVLPEGKGFFVENSRRGHIYQLFRASQGESFLAVADIFSRQSPSGMVYIRMDFFDDQRNLIGSSSRGRLSPVRDFATTQHLRAYGKAPEGTVRGRVLIRFFEMDPNSRAEVYKTQVFKIAPEDHP